MEKQYKPVPDIEALRCHGTPEKSDFYGDLIILGSGATDDTLKIAQE